MKIAVVTVSPQVLGHLMGAARRLDAGHPGCLNLSLFDAHTHPDQAALTRLRDAVQGGDAVVIDLMGADPAWSGCLSEALDACPGQIIASGWEFAQRSRVSSPAVFGQLMQAFHNMDSRAADFFLALLVHESGEQPDLVVPELGRERPGVFPADPTSRTRYPTIEAFLAHKGGPEGRPVVVLPYYASTYPADTWPCIAGLSEALSSVCWVLPLAVATDVATAPTHIRKLLDAGRLHPDLIVDIMSFRFSAGPQGGDPQRGTDLLDELGAPLVHPLLLHRRTEAQWRDSPAGLSPSEVLVTLMLPELDGCLDEIVVGAMSEARFDPDYGVSVNELKLIPEQVQRLVDRVAGLLRLRRLANHDKRVAVIGYDYPAGEGRLLGGAFLDVTASISALMGELAADGYRTDTPSSERLLDDLLANAINNPRFVTAGTPLRYRRADFERDLANPDALGQVQDAWAGAPDLPMTTPDGDFEIPVVEYGNLLVGIQPGRGPSDDPAHRAHDLSLPPHPQYLAFYTWLHEVWRPDVIVHVGTHGTLEFLKAKENAISTRCFPDLMMGGVPHVYLYYAGNASEALIARRRSHACLVSYQPPVLSPGGLHDELAELDRLLHEYRRAQSLAPQTSADIAEAIVASATAAHLPTNLDALEQELERLQNSLVPLGLHTFGTTYSHAEAATMVAAMVGHGCAELPPAVDLMAAAQGLGPASFDALPNTVRAELNQRVNQLIQDALADLNTPAETLASDPGLVAMIDRARQLMATLTSNNEWSGLRKALSGRHVGARLGGDPIRSPEIFPSGGSLFQFDPRQVPSAIATRRGAQIASAVRASYRDAHDGAEPRCIGVVLWGLETSRTQGESYAQIMALLGVRPTSTPRPGRDRWEVIPTDELDGPRVDVVITICGFFRDLFGTLIDELDDMVSAVARLDEPADINPIAARTRALQAMLRANGANDQDAEALSHARLFGPAPGLYGTGLTDIVDSGNWETSQDLADAFLAAAQHVYTRRRHGEAIEGLYRRQLGDVEVVSQTRSSNEYEVTDLDHYFEYLGGLSASVAAVRGAPVQTLVTDTTGRAIHTTSAREATASGLRTRLLNPAWIDAMLAHHHRGGAEIATRLTNLIGLAATTSQVEDWMFDALFDRFLADETMRARLATNNPHALAELADRFAEADRRGLWQADPHRQECLDQVRFQAEADIESVSEPGFYPSTRGES